VAIGDATPQDWPAVWSFLREVLATIPEGFRHPTDGYVGLHVMYRRL
jgi:hypothetical protein